METKTAQEKFTERFNYALDILNLSIHSADLWAIDENLHQDVEKSHSNLQLLVISERSD